MTGTDSDDERDKRIRTEVIVDAYTPDEQAISWCYYLEDKLTVPFEAECVENRSISPLKEGEIVTVVGGCHTIHLIPQASSALDFHPVRSS